MKPKLRSFLCRAVVRTIHWAWALQCYVPWYTYGKYVGLASKARLCLARGNNVRAERDARQLLEIASGYESDWNYGNAIHHANVILGRVALRRGDLSGAKHYLLKSAEVPGSPQLAGFGPNMRLAKELLDTGDDEVVLDYLDRCRTFWKMGADSIEHWQAQIRNGQSPNFGPNLIY